MSNLADKLEVATTAQAEGNDPGWPHAEGPA